VALLVALGVLGARVHATADFETTRTVTVEPPSIIGDTREPQPEQREMTLFCRNEGGGDYREDGETMVFNGSMWSPESPRPICDAARDERTTTSAAIVLVSLAAAGAVLLDGRVRARRAEAAEQQHVTHPTRPSG